MLHWPVAFLTMDKLIPIPEPPLPILAIRGKPVVLDSDLARLYGVQTRELNKAVKRNAARFPADFVFQLTSEEFASLMFQNGTSSSHGGRRKLPWAFTEHGAIMAASVLNSPRAVAMSVYVVRAFVRMREELIAGASLEKRLAEIERTLIGHDVALKDLYQKLKPLLLPPPDPPRPQIGFHVKEDNVGYRVASKRVGQ
jgi:ORF6N domain-containing protein